MGSTTLATRGLSFSDTGNGDTFSASGQIVITFAEESLTVLLQTPDGGHGLVIDAEDNLVSLSARIVNDFELLGATFVVDESSPLTFEYDASADHCLLFGSAAIKTNDGSSSQQLTVTIGSGHDAPGLIVDNSGVSLFKFGLQDDFTYDGVKVEIGSLDTAFTFIYDSVNNVYESYGDVGISYATTGSTFTASIGDANDPGLILFANASSEMILHSLNAAITGNFCVDNLKFQIDEADPLTFIYSADSDFFEIDGSLQVAVEDDMIGATFGYDVRADDGSTTSYPGMRMKNGNLVGVDFLISESFSIAGIEMQTTANGIGFSHTGISDYYYAFGGIQIAFDGQTIAFDAGSFESPGIISSADSSNGGIELEFLLISLSGNLNLYGVEFIPDDLTFNYQKTDGSASDIFEFYGDLSMGVDGVDVSAYLGTEDSPGFSFAGGALQNLDIGISESITLSGLTIETTGDYFGVSYNPANQLFELFGGLSVSFDGQTLGLQAGVANAPGMQLIGNSQNHFILSALDATLSADFSLYGIDVSLGDDGVTFVYDSAEDLYEVYGDIDISIDGDTVDAFLGDADTPGFSIESGVVESVDIGIATDISLGGFEFSSPEDDPLTITYSSDNTTYTVFGEAELDTLWDVTVTLGDADNPGIEIINNQWHIDDLSIEVDRINLGFCQIKEVAVEYSRDSQTNDILVDITLDVIVPELQGEIDATVTTDAGKITSIYLEYLATGSTEGIEILDTGVNVAELGVYLQNLDQPADLIFDGSIGLEFGGQISIDGTTVTLAYTEGDVYVDKTKLSISDSVYFGAVEQDDDWSALIFEGDGEMLLNWANNSYSVSSDLYLPTDYGIKITDDLLITNEYIILQADAKVRVPDGIPLIGGEDLGDIGFDLLIDMDDGSKSFGAAWVDIHLIGQTEEAGIKYKFDGGDIVFIGSGEIKNLGSQIETVEDSIAQEGITYLQQTYTFDFDDANSFIADMSWYLDDGSGTPKDISEMRISITGTVRDLINQKTHSNSALSMNVMSFTDGAFTTAGNGDGDSGSLFLDFTNSMGAKLSTQGFIKQSSIEGETIIDQLWPGSVVITFQYPESLALGASVVINKPTITNFDNLKKPTISIVNIEDDDAVSTTVSAFNTDESCYDAWRAILDSNPDASDNLFFANYNTYKDSWCITTSTSDSTLHAGQLLDINMHGLAPDKYAGDTVVTIFADTDNSGHDGVPIMSNIAYSASSNYSHLGITYRIFDKVWTVQNVTQEQNGKVYFYASIQNGQQSTGYSGYSEAFTIESPVYGVVYDTDKSNPLEGFRVFLDVDGDKQYDAETDRSTLTNSSGKYVFDNVADGEFTVGVIVPVGFSTNTVDEDIITTSYLSGNSVEVDFNVNLLDAISGYVFEDSNNDGLLSENESGIQGVSLYLDVNKDGSYNNSVDIQTITDKGGFWRFYNIEVESSYDIYILAYPSQISNQDENSITVETTTQTSAGDEVVAPSFASFETTRANSAAPTSSATQYTEFSHNNFGIVPDAVENVRDRKFMSYILAYFPEDLESNNIADLDPDNDGLSNKIEQLFDTNPLVANPRPNTLVTIGERSDASGNQSLLVEFEQVASNRYVIQQSSDLENWTIVDTYRAHTSELMLLEILLDPDTPSSFIRIQIED